MLKFYQPAS